MTHGYFPYASNSRIRLFGTLKKGGRLILEDVEGRDEPIPVKLPPRLYQVIWLLIEASQKDASGKTETCDEITEDNQSVDALPIGFRDAQQLAQRQQEICHHCNDQLDANQIPTIVLRLRRLLEARVSRKWAYDFLEYQEFFGYRISTEPKNQDFG